MNQQPIPAPGGWGFRPGADLLGRVRSDLPKAAAASRHRQGISRADDHRSHRQDPMLLRTLTDRQLMDAYGIGRSLAYHCRKKQAKDKQADA